MILFRRATSAATAGCSSPEGGDCSVMDRLAYGDASEGLVDMHAEVLLAIAAETNGVVVAEHLFNAIDESTFGHLQLAQDAHDQLWIADCSPYAGKRLLQIPDKINTAGPPQNDALLDGAKEGRAAVGVGLLDRANIVRSTDQHQYRLCCKSSGVETLHVRPDELGVALGGRSAIDLKNDPPLSVRRRYHDPPLSGDKVLGLECPEGHVGGDQGEHGTIRVKGAVVIHQGPGETKTITRGTSHQWELPEGILETSGDRFFAHRQAVDQQESETVARVGLRFQAFRSLQQILRERLRLNSFELLQLIEATTGSGKALGGKARSLSLIHISEPT